VRSAISSQMGHVSLCRSPVSVCLSVCLSVTSRCSTETSKRAFIQTTPQDNPHSLVFWCRRSRQNRVIPAEAPDAAGVDYNSSAVAEIGDSGHNRHGPKRGELLCPFRGGAGSPSNTMWPGPRSTSVPSGVFIHRAVWPQQT